MPLKWLFERITIITSIVYLSLIMHQGLGQMFYIHYFFSIFQITLQGDTILICAVSEAEGGGLESPGWDGVPAASLWLWEMGLEIPRSCFSNLLFTVDKSENQPGGFIVWPRDKVKRKLKILEVQFLAQESVHISIPGPRECTHLYGFDDPACHIGPQREWSKKHPPARYKGWVSSCLPNWSSVFLIFLVWWVEKYPMITVNAF